MNLKESIRKVLREETLEEGGVMDSLKKFFGKKEKTPEDRLVNIIVELIKQTHTINYGSGEEGEVTFYLTDNEGNFIFPPIMKYYPKQKSLHYSWDFAQDIHNWIGDDRLLKPDSELIGKVFEKLYKKNVNYSFGYSRL
jgi:hypothetical protein